MTKNQILDILKLIIRDNKQIKTRKENMKTKKPHIIIAYAIESTTFRQGVKYSIHNAKTGKNIGNTHFVLPLHNLKQGKFIIDTIKQTLGLNAIVDSLINTSWYSVGNDFTNL